MKNNLTRPAKPLWMVMTLLVVAALACNMGSPDPADVRATTGPRPRPTATEEVIEETEEPDPEPTEEITDDPVDDPVDDPGGGTLTRDERENLIAATVQIFGLFEQSGDLVVGYTGSGTLISPDGLILTNAHVASPASQGSADFEPDALAVALVEREDEPPVASYMAEVMAVDGYLDLAVIRVVATLDGDEIDTRDLDLPFVDLGDSDFVRVGDPINIFGFPGIGGETLTFTTGNVSGFTAEDQLGNRAWIKTDATIAGGNSGGLAADNDGFIIGVPTIASSGAQGDITDCRVVQDTNGDGQLDERDSCVPIGGFINALRPINLALPLIEAADEGLAYESPFETGGQSIAQGSGQEQMSEITWYSVDEEGNLDQPVESYPSGSTVLVATFDFAGMTDGQEWSEVWYQDEALIYQDAYAWDQGEEGSYYTWISSGDEPLQDGEYTVELFSTPEERLTVGTVTVGGGGGTVDPNGNTDPPADGDVLVFGTISDGDTGQPIQGAYFVVLNPGVVYEAWDGAQADIYTVAETDAEGSFLMPGMLKYDTEYTIVVGAEGYQTKFGDGLVWTTEDPALYIFDVELVR